MTLLGAYLLCGMAAHKLVWEVLKRRQHAAGAGPAPARSMMTRLQKAVKVAILAGVAIQTMLPDVLPIADNPTALRTVGVTLFTLGLIVAIVGRVQLGENWADIEAAQVLAHQAVVSTGLYRYIRHPIYTGDLLLLLGLQLSLNSWLVLGVLVLVPFVVWRAAREERMLAGRLPDYATYRAHTWRFVPFVA
jgi:protein-S-isoprenylcysteine O-methyltransferase Ste14